MIFESGIQQYYTFATRRNHTYVSVSEIRLYTYIHVAKGIDFKKIGTWVPHGSPLGPPWVPHGAPMGPPWVPRGSPMGPPWVPQKWIFGLKNG